MVFTGLDDIARILAIAGVFKDDFRYMQLLDKYGGTIYIVVEPRDDGYYDVRCNKSYSGNIAWVTIQGVNNSVGKSCPPFYVECTQGDVVTIGAKIDYQPITDDWGISTPKDITSNNTNIVWPNNIIEALVATAGKRVSKNNIRVPMYNMDSNAWVALIEMDVTVTAKENQDGTLSLESTWPTICLDQNCNYKIEAGGPTPQLNIPPGKTVIAKHYVLLKYQSAQG